MLVIMEVPMAEELGNGGCERTSKETSLGEEKFILCREMQNGVWQHNNSVSSENN